MPTFNVTTVGTSAGLITTGDKLHLTEAPDGGYHLTPYDPDFGRQIRLAEDLMHEDRDILQGLAK
ncbi:MAG: transcriptional regulator [Alphaproteobacteria bacterium]|nr:transcriptional regulator [Alphaproteobacteria bacterium]